MNNIKEHPLGSENKEETLYCVGVVVVLGVEMLPRT